MDENFKSSEPIQDSASPAQESPQPGGSPGNLQQPSKKSWSRKKITTVIVSTAVIFAIGFAGGITANAVIQTGRGISARVLERSGASHGHAWDGWQPQADANDRGQESGSQDDPRSRGSLDFPDERQDNETAPDAPGDQAQGFGGLFGPGSRWETKEGQDDSGPRQDKGQNGDGSLNFGSSEPNCGGGLFRDS